MRQYQHVDKVWVGRSRSFAERLIEHYARGGSPQSRSRSGNRGTEANLTRQWQGKTGECAFALHIGHDPSDAVKWDLQPDQGGDLKLPDGNLVDVKTTLPRYKLIWSNNVNDLYDKKKFNFLVAVSIDENDYCHCWIEGCISKQDFLKRKRIADGYNSGLERDTWFLDKRELDEIPFHWFKQHELCPRCQSRGTFGYRDTFGTLLWYCAQHKLGECWADARRDGMI